MSVSFTTSNHPRFQESFTDSLKSPKSISHLSFGNDESSSNARIVDTQKTTQKQDCSLIEHGGYIVVEFSLEDRHLNDQLKILIKSEGSVRMKLNGRTFFSENSTEERIPLASLVRNRVIHPGINTLTLEPAHGTLKIEKFEILLEKEIS